MATEAIVSFVVEKLCNLLIEEVELLHQVHSKIESLERELTRMQCFLKDFDAKQKQQKEDAIVTNWVAEIIDVSYDAEDVIDTFILNESARIAQRRGQGLAGPVKRYIRKLKTRRKVGKEIQRIKLKISDISSGLTNYGIKNINDGGQETRLNIRRSSALYEEPDIIGMQESVITLKEQLLNEEARRCVISIVGMGGSGKTTLAKKVYQDVKDNFDCHALIYLSQQYRIRDVLISIIAECGMNLSSEEKEKSNEGELRKKLYGCLNEKRYLVVIDDIWTMEAWTKLKFILPDGLNRSRVMLTTRNKEIALHADQLSQPHSIRLLEEAESWELFHKKIFPNGDVCPSELKETGKKIVAKCDGLPLAIVVLGGLLSRREKTLIAWSKVLDSVPWHLADQDSEDHEIKSKQLIRLWVAEGLIQQRGNEIMEDVAEDYLEELIGRSMIQVAGKRSDGSVSRCRIHDLLRDLSISEARKVNFFGIDSDNGSTSSSTSLRRVALHRNMVEYETINRSTATLRSLLYFCISTINLSNLLNRCGKLLRVLHVDSAYLQEKKLPEEIGKKAHLRYLEVYGIRYFPASVNYLSNLQAIILPSGRGTLPNAIWDLERLRHLYAYNWDIDGHPRLSNFRNLLTLCLNAGSWIEDGLDKLSNLKKLGIVGIARSHHKALSDAVEKLCNLRSLKLSLSDSIPPFVSFANHKNLYKMYLSGRIENLPEMLPNLTKLTLYESQLKQDAIETLEKLENLRVLRLEAGSYCSEKMICSSRGFSRLESLELNCSNLKNWTVEKEAMKSLRRLKLGANTHLKALPNELADLSQ